MHFRTKKILKEHFNSIHNFLTNLFCRPTTISASDKALTEEKKIAEGNKCCGAKRACMHLPLPLKRNKIRKQSIPSMFFSVTNIDIDKG